MNRLALFFILAGAASAQVTTPSTVSVTLLFEGPVEQTIGGTPQLRIKPHVPFRITNDSGLYWSIPAYWQTIDVTSTTGDQVIAMHPNKPGASSYTISPETYYDYEYIDSTGSYRGKVQITYGAATEWGEIHIDDTVDSTSAYLLPPDILAGEGVTVGQEGSTVRITNTTSGFAAANVLAGTGVSVGVEGTSVRITSTAGSAIVEAIEAGPNVAVTGSAARPIVSADSATVTPTWNNVQSKPSLVNTWTAGTNMANQGSVADPIASADSSTITPTWDNVQSKPATLVSGGIEAGNNIAIGGSAARPIVSADSSTITPTWTNVQSKPSTIVEAIEAGNNVAIGGSSARPVVSADSSTITPTWSNVQSKPSTIVEAIEAGNNVAIGGSSARPIVSADSATITPTWTNVQSKPSIVNTITAGTNVANQGSAADPIISADSATITPTWSNVQSKPATFDPTTPLTTKGDLWGFSTVSARVPKVSTNGLPLVTDESDTEGIQYLALGGDITGSVTDTRVSKLQTKNVSTTAPTDGQVLMYEADYSEYYPQTPGGGGSLTGQLAGGSDTTIDTINASVTGQLEATIVGDTLTISGTSGKLVQSVDTLSDAQSYDVATGTTAMSATDTKSQNTEGTEFMTLTITPRAVGNILKIRATILCSHAVSGEKTHTAALFRDSVADALTTTAVLQKDAAFNHLELTAKYIVTQAGAITFKVRAGLNTADTITFNGYNGARFWNTSNKSHIEIEEVLP